MLIKSHPGIVKINTKVADVHNLKVVLQYADAF